MLDKANRDKRKLAIFRCSNNVVGGSSSKEDRVLLKYQITMKQLLWKDVKRDILHFYLSRSLKVLLIGACEKMRHLR